jgi:hypothetical protein
MPDSETILKALKPEQQQRAILDIQVVLEELASRNSNIKTNDLALHSDYRLDDNHLAVTGIPNGISKVAEYELEPTMMMPSHESKIPSVIQ